MSVSTTALEMLMLQTYGIDDKRDFMENYGLDSDTSPTNSVKKISLNITPEEESIIYALEQLKDNFAGSSKSEIIRTLITIAFDHIKKETKELWIPTGVSQAIHGEIILPMALVLKNHQKAYLSTDTPEDYAEFYTDLCIEQYNAIKERK